MSEPLLRAMRHSLLEHLAEFGAGTLAELRQRPPQLLLLMLNEPDLLAAVDSCRRHRLIEPLDPAARDLESAEWGLTDLGRKAARSPFGSLIDRLAQLLQVVVISTTFLVGLLGAATGLEFDLRSLDPGTAFVLLMLAVAGGQLLAATMNDRRHRVSRARIAADWERLARERPLMHRLHTRKRWLLWPAVGVLLVGETLILLDPKPSAPILAVILLCFAPWVAVQYRLGSWHRAATREALDSLRTQLERARAAVPTPAEPQPPPPGASPA